MLYVLSLIHIYLRGPRGGIILMGKDFENPWGPVSYTHLDVYKRQGKSQQREQREGADERHGDRHQGNDRRAPVPIRTSPFSLAPA